MSIKTIDQDIRSNTTGMAKRINKGAEKMVFDILQATQYSTPIPSTIRELVTNACDSQREKEMAIEILKGEKTEEDYYIRRDGEQYADSNFDPTYYDLNCLDTDQNEIVIKYIKREGVGFCDTVQVIDYGVGIGGRRLEGVLELGYSTKRNTSQNFGAFGLGAKVALSTGADFYTIETVHNGKRFKCNCYPYKTDFMIPKFNPSITFTDGSKVHYEPTTDKNYTIIQFGVKKHNRNRIEEAIIDQLNYLGNVKFLIEEDEQEREKTIQSNIVHNSKHIIVSNSYTYSKPHIVIVKEEGALTGINYGYVDFRELEMEQLWGAVGLKCPMRQAIKDPETGEEIVVQDGVEVTPSREKVIWNEHTKKFIQSVIQKATEEATELVEEELKETDLLKWVQSCRDVLSRSIGYHSNTALQQISKIIDTGNMKPKFPSDTSIHFQGPIATLRGFSPRSISEHIKEGKLHISTDKLETWGEVDFDAIYYRDADTSRSRLKDHYLISLSSRDKFMLITDKNLTNLKDADTKSYLKVVNHRNKITPHLKSSELFNSYEDVEVPEEWEDTFQSREKTVEETDALTGLSPAERREVEQRIVAFTLRYNHRSTYNGSRMYTWDKVEPKLSQVMSSEHITYYGTSKDAEKLYLAATVLFTQAPHSGKSTDVKYYFADNTQEGDPLYYVDELPVRFGGYTLNEGFELETPQLLKVSESNVKYIARNSKCLHIDEFFSTWDEENNKITMDKSLRRYLTGKAIGNVPDWIRELNFINPDYKKMYDLLTNCTDSYSRIYESDSDGIKEIVSMVEKIKELQDFSESVDDPVLVANKSKELFILEDVKAAEALDYELITLSKMMKEFIEDVDPLMSQIRFKYNDSEEFKKEIIHYLKSRGKLDIEIPLPQTN
jgi:hypothetical protein